MAARKYEYNFIDELSDKLKCLICLDVAKDPKQHETCGKIFCSECIEKNKDKPCPSCRTKSPNYFTDTRGEENNYLICTFTDKIILLKGAQEIRDLPVRCNNFDKGCGWQGSVGTLDKHMATCEFECVLCKYQYVGCDVKMMRKDIAQHEEEDDKKHLHLALQHIIPTLSGGESFVFKMTEYSSKKRNKEVFFSDPFYTNLNGYKMRVKIHVNGTGSGEGTHMSVSLLFLKGPYDQSLRWPFLGEVTFTILNQMGDYNHSNRFISVLRNDDVKPGGCKDMETFIAHSMLSEELPDKVMLLKNDTLFFRVSVKFSGSLSWLECGKKMHPKSCEVVLDGQPLVFKLHGYMEAKCNDIFYDRSFFTSPSGYRIVIRTYPNGDGAGKGTHLSIRAAILDGPYDQSLSWPFLGKIKLELLNQLFDEHHYGGELECGKQNNMQVGSNQGFLRFIEHSQLQVGDKQFLMNDILYVRVTVKLDNHKPWLAHT